MFFQTRKVFNSDNFSIYVSHIKVETNKTTEWEDDF